ncbi:monosaccharide ABC transporter membrane protein (CUT2 family) [Sinorhizobium medicae]|nr:ABC transporter permease [Sinorhizobium medicae]MBO1941958.1 ABC transporter permease [Sinorhizobium medicae]TWA17689.1 monosaccharide ABC transporter membrane protein (CUT2 family) [Sinorhizobium medicae]TWA19533.1 monosaccharide ABC transporter membrane protein (CUT2 family) [Sinorhizobium medicae]TWA31215.1 monosaccharide ABC transporter membrane protein (CUT2 family) [Sinorhizobium medicae]TWA34012.1 monosaccharide ABC transporter membrane protein (CUT2 family) [Sinorhizobium medicae]
MMPIMRNYAGRLLPQCIALVIIVIAISIVFPGFLNLQIQNGRLYGSLIDILNRGAPVVLLAIGMTVVIATKGIDLSVGAVMAICGAVAASLITSGHSLAETLLATLAIGILCGIWNGVLVAFLDIQPIIATLVLMVAGRGIAQLITEGTILTFNEPGLIFIGSGSFIGLPMPIVIWLVFGLLVAVLVRRTALGMLIEAIGINRQASTLSGVLTPVLLVAAYVLSGLCAAIAGIIAAADIRGADANNAGLWLELDAILAVVVGGTSLLGGRFSIAASVLGAIIIQAINTGILLSGFPPEFNLIIKAAIIIFILVLQSPRFRTAFSFLSIPGAAGKPTEREAK